MIHLTLISAHKFFKNNICAYDCLNIVTTYSILHITSSDRSRKDVVLDSASLWSTDSFPDCESTRGEFFVI